MYKLSPSIGPVKWRYGVEARFQFNAQRCRKIAQGLTDPEERAYTLNLAKLWEQLAEAARFRQEFGSATRSRPGPAITPVVKTG
jgi:hypothetical protein